MESNFNYVASLKSKEELKELIANRKKYLPETVEASIAELKNRGIEFTEDELQTVNRDIQEQRDKATLVNSGQGFKGTYKNNIVEDTDAPLLYSRRAVFYFTCFMGAYFGSILLAINFNKLKNRKGILWVLLFGISFTIIQIILVSYTNRGSSPSILYGLLAGFCVDYFFWPYFIGQATMYRARKIWTSLVIAILLSAFFIWGTIYSSTQ